MKMKLIMILLLASCNSGSPDNPKNGFDTLKISDTSYRLMDGKDTITKVIDYNGNVIAE